MFLQYFGSFRCVLESPYSSRRVDTHRSVSRLPVSCMLLFAIPRKSSTKSSFIIMAMWMLPEQSPLRTQTDARNWTSSGPSGSPLNPQRTRGSTYIQHSISWKAECLRCSVTPRTVSSSLASKVLVEELVPSHGRLQIWTSRF